MPLRRSLTVAAILASAACPAVADDKPAYRVLGADKSRVAIVNARSEVEWEVVAQQTYPITIRIEAIDRPGLLNDITKVVAEANVNIVAASVGTLADGSATLTLTLKVTSLQQLSKVLARIESVRDVTGVTREQH